MFNTGCPRCGESITFNVEATTDGDGGAALEASRTVCGRCNFEVRIRGIEAHLVIDDARVYTPINTRTAYPKGKQVFSKYKSKIFKISFVESITNKGYLYTLLSDDGDKVILTHGFKSDEYSSILNGWEWVIL